MPSEERVLTDLIQARMKDLIEYFSSTNLTIEHAKGTAVAMIRHVRALNDGKIQDYLATTIHITSVNRGRRRGRITRTDVLCISIRHNFTKDIKFSIKSDKKITNSRLFKIRNELIEFENKVNIAIDLRHKELTKENKIKKKFTETFPMLEPSGDDLTGMDGDFEISSISDEVTLFNITIKNQTKEQVLKVWESLNPDLALKQREQEKKKVESRFDLIGERWG
jgi:hypothetical protein